MVLVLWSSGMAALPAGVGDGNPQYKVKVTDSARVGRLMEPLLAGRRAAGPAKRYAYPMWRHKTPHV
jgi:hypothetical protein